MTFVLPGLELNVAPECSGIRSTLVLLITGIIAGGMFLRGRWSRLVLAAVFYPIGVLRNGLRIVTIALLSIHVDPTIMDGPVHTRGGPPFFALSLVPLFGVLFILRRVELLRSRGQLAGLTQQEVRDEGSD